VHINFLVIQSELAENLPFPFDELRANGAGVEVVQDCPFVLSLSKHDHGLWCGPRQNSDMHPPSGMFA